MMISSRTPFFHLGVNISELPNPKKHMVMVDISQRRCKCITEEEVINIVRAEDRMREVVIA